MREDSHHHLIAGPQKRCNHKRERSQWRAVLCEDNFPYPSYYYYSRTSEVLQPQKKEERSALRRALRVDSLTAPQKRNQKESGLRKKKTWLDREPSRSRNCHARL